MDTRKTIDLPTEEHYVIYYIEKNQLTNYIPIYITAY